MFKKSLIILLLYIGIIILVIFTRLVEARIISFELTKEMEIISQYIEKSNFNLPQIIADKIAYEVVTQCNQNKEPVPLILAIIQTESNFNPLAVSQVKARGLMQILDEEYQGKKIDKAKLHDIEYNIKYGIKILKQKLSITKNLTKALYCYSGRSATYSGKVYENVANFLYYQSQQ